MTLSILTFFTQIFQFIIQGLFGLISGSFDFILSLAGSSIQSVSEQFALSVEAFGIWSVPMLVVVLSITAIGVYAILSGSEMVEGLI
ncbi:hypothetical protein IX51_04805 [uncultured archaeon]|nr:hypothetical protein IX51_04805 [uncultured archaeon]